MLEVEVKYALPDPAALEATLAERGATFDPPRRDADHYFNAPDRDFAATDEAFRVRTIGEENFVTYKGPKIDRDTKSRVEHEIALRDGPDARDEFCQLLIHLGYRPVAVVAKSRRIAHLSRDGFDVQVSLDDVDEVGHYVEIEVVAEADRFTAAKTTVLALAAELGLTQVERHSYLGLLLERRRNGP
ncbi:MAG: class IV adenylate cyclase [Gemmataceae bacterium]